MPEITCRKQCGMSRALLNGTLWVAFSGGGNAGGELELLPTSDLLTLPVPDRGPPGTFVPSRSGIISGTGANRA
jgi:hypothetical protein